MSDLRETLAKKMMSRFHYCGVCSEQTPVPEYWFALADECIRQMRHAVARWPEDAYPGSGSEFIAPDDWKPTTKEEE